MNARDDFDRSISDWLEGATSPRTSYLGDVLERTGRTRQRPAWMSPGRWLPMQTSMRLAMVPRLAWLLVVLALAVVLATIANLAAGTTPHSTIGPGLAKPGLIAFDAESTIFVAAADGTNRRSISQGFDPVFSPDGTWIAFWARNRYVSDSFPYLAVIAVDGTGEHHVTRAPFVMESSPNVALYRFAWSPDSRRLAYSDTHQIWIAERDHHAAQLGEAPGQDATAVTDRVLDASDPVVARRDADRVPRRESSRGLRHEGRRQ